MGYQHQGAGKIFQAFLEHFQGGYVQVVGGPEGEGITRLRACEISLIGEEPTHLGPREHAFVVTKYEACLAAHLLIAFELDKSLAQQRQYCR